MSFLDLFSPAHLQLFLDIGSTQTVTRGEYLLRRGEPGGDIYLLERGTLEVIDTRSTPEVILAVLEQGAVVGEMAFLDDAPRSADVRAQNDVLVRRWARDDLRAILDRQAKFAAAFYKNIAKLAAARSRRITSSAVSGALTGHQSNAVGVARMREEAKGIADAVKEGLLDAETRLRHDPGDRMAQQEVRRLMDELQDEVRTLFLAHPEPDATAAGMRLLGRELHPYLVRSSLADRCIRRPEGASGTAEILAHVLVNTAGGDGQVGEILDRWLLDRPMLEAMRAFRDPLIRAIKDHLPRHRNRRVLLVNAGTGSLVAGLLLNLAQPPTVLTVMDQSRDALAFLDAGMTTRPRAVELRTVQENLAQFALGRKKPRLPPQDAIILHGLVEYMPDRIAVSLLKVARSLLAVGGAVFIAALGPSHDQQLMDRLLAWPTIRRTPEHMRMLLTAASLESVVSPSMTAPAQVFGATPTTPAHNTTLSPLSP